MTGIVLYLARAGWQKRTLWFWVIIFLLIVALGPSDAHSVAEYLTGWVIRFLPFAAGAIVIIEFLE